MELYFRFYKKTYAIVNGKRFVNVCALLTTLLLKKPSARVGQVTPLFLHAVAYLFLRTSYTYIFNAVVSSPLVGLATRSPIPDSNRRRLRELNALRKKAHSATSGLWVERASRSRYSVGRWKVDKKSQTHHRQPRTGNLTEARDKDSRVVMAEELADKTCSNDLVRTYTYYYSRAFRLVHSNGSGPK